MKKAHMNRPIAELNEEIVNHKKVKSNLRNQEKDGLFNRLLENLFR